jgi:hypothetical protein
VKEYLPAPTVGSGTKPRKIAAERPALAAVYNMRISTSLESHWGNVYPHRIHLTIWLIV